MKRRKKNRRKKKEKDEEEGEEEQEQWEKQEAENLFTIVLGFELRWMRYDLNFS